MSTAALVDAVAPTQEKWQREQALRALLLPNCKLGNLCMLRYMQQLKIYRILVEVNCDNWSFTQLILKVIRTLSP